MRWILCLLVSLPLLAGSPANAADGKGKHSKPVVRGEKNAKFPSFSPDGKQVAFSLYGDLWILPSGGGFARRITLSDAFDTKPRWSPDGKWIAFSSTRSGNWDV